MPEEGVVDSACLPSELNILELVVRAKGVELSLLTESLSLA